MKAGQRTLTFKCIRIRQPIGDFFIGSIPNNSLCDITFVDVRRIEGERGFETYLGIQRPLSQKRVKEISNYVKSPDACFPTAVILAVPAVCAVYDEDRQEMTLMEFLEPKEGEEQIKFHQIAKVIDGQHRIEGLRAYKGVDFEINVSIFVEMDIADQAYLFSTVNLAQTKVNKSLVYDLFDLAKTRSPQKTCHNIAVALDKHEKSPLFERIKRLGVATQGRFDETLAQATVVESLMKYISKDPASDRNLYMLHKSPKPANANELKELIFRNMFLEERDLEITDVLWNFFDAVRRRWPTAWNFKGRGLILNKTNGFKALMRFLRPAYLHLTNPGGVPKAEDFATIFDRIQIKDDEFNTENYLPGTEGESTLYRALLDQSKIAK